MAVVMNHVDTVKRRLIQVDPYEDLGSLELTINLGPHLSISPFFVDESRLEDFLRVWYEEWDWDTWPEGWRPEVLAEAICEEFKL